MMLAWASPFNNITSHLIYGEDYSLLRRQPNYSSTKSAINQLIAHAISLKMI